MASPTSPSRVATTSRASTSPAPSRCSPTNAPRARPRSRPAARAAPPQRRSSVPGLFLTFEGGDGSGKSTQSALLTEWLTENGHTVVHAREPGGTDFGNEVREIVLHRRGDIAPRAEALLYAADRAHNIATVVR